jgi:hypothetical protein
MRSVLPLPDHLRARPKTGAAKHGIGTAISYGIGDFANLRKVALDNPP